MRLLLRQLAIPHEAVRLDIVGGEVRAKEFRKVADWLRGEPHHPMFIGSTFVGDKERVFDGL